MQTVLWDRIAGDSSNMNLISWHITSSAFHNVYKAKKVSGLFLYLKTHLKLTVIVSSV